MRLDDATRPGEALLLDGGMGTLLQAMGLSAGKAPETWLLEAPERIEAAHRAYVEAGSDVIQTATFGASPAKLATIGLAGRCAELNAIAVGVARRAAGPGVRVAGNIGPSGLLLPPMGTAREEEVEAGFREQASALAGAGADLISIETMFDVREALCAVRAAVATGLPVWASMTFEPAPDGWYTMMGDELAASLFALREAGATTVGMNCSVPSDVMRPMLEHAVRSVGGALLAEPNAGPPVLGADGRVVEAPAGPFAADLVAMVRAGATMVGGCCGTTPAFIRAVREALGEG